MKRHVVPLLSVAAVLVAGCGSAAQSEMAGAGGSPSPVTHPHPKAMPWPAYDAVRPLGSWQPKESPMPAPWSTS